MYKHACMKEWYIITWLLEIKWLKRRFSSDPQKSDFQSWCSLYHSGLCSFSEIQHLKQDYCTSWLLHWILHSSAIGSSSWNNPSSSWTFPMREAVGCSSRAARHSNRLPESSFCLLSAASAALLMNTVLPLLLPFWFVSGNRNGLSAARFHPSLRAIEAFFT